MYIEPAARSKDAEHLPDHLLRLIGVMENAVRIDIIKACVVKRKMPRIRLMNNCEIAHASARQLYMVRR